MWTIALLSAVALFNLVQGACNSYERNYYADIGCVLEAEDTSGCPLSYDCSQLAQKNSNKCYYQGKAFSEGVTLESVPESPCLVECNCQRGYNDTLAFSCVNVECPSELGSTPEPGCYYFYEHGNCCNVKEVCGAEEKTPKDVCNYNNTTYRVGEQFYPEEHPCLECICGPGFAGLLQEPFCRKINCSLELNYPERIMDGCIPVYYGDNHCCPHDWRCPDDSDSIVASESESGSKHASDSGKVCKFGGLSLRIGDKLNSVTEAGGERQCYCRVPPHPICIETPLNRELEVNSQ